MERLSVKTLLRDFVIIIALTGVAGLYASLAMPGKLGTIEHASMSRILTLLLVTVGFFGIACLSSGKRWLQIIIVFFLTCIVDGAYNLLLLGNPISIWIQNSFHIAIAAVIGGAFSYVIKGYRQPSV